MLTSARPETGEPALSRAPVRASGAGPHLAQVAPHFFPLPAFGRGQPAEGAGVAQAGEVAVSQPAVDQWQDFGAGVGRLLCEPPAPGVHLASQPDPCLTAEARLLGLPQVAGILTLARTGQDGGPGGQVAV